MAMPKKSPPSSIMENLATDIHHRASIAFPDASPAPLSQFQNSQVPNSQVHSRPPPAGSYAQFHPAAAHPHITHAYCPPYIEQRYLSGGRRSFSNNSGYNPAIHFGMSHYPHQKPSPWMNKLCHEPEGDLGTCCVGCWAPCALYGKTQYRLKQMSQGDDPLDLVGQKNRPALPMAERTDRGEDEEWEEVQGYKACNGPCWMHQMLCFFFRTEWCVVMLQHSRVRATYNIDGTAGGDCVQSYFCTRCTAMQDEREVIDRERRILRQQNGSGRLITDQPGGQMQMRYSTSNLLEEIPDILRDGFNGGANGYPSSSNLPSQQSSGRGSFNNGTSRGKAKGEHHESHELANLTPAAIAYGTDISDPETEHGSRGRRSSAASSRKLEVLESSPLGSALNPITVSRSASVDLGKNSKGFADVPQRCITNPSRMRYNQAPIGAPSPRVLAYKLRSLDLGDERRGFGFEAIQERGSEESGPTVGSRTAVKSLAMESLRSVASLQRKDRERAAKEKRTEDEELKLSDEGQTVFFGVDGRVIRRRISECLRPRASSSETPEIYALRHVGPRTMKVSKMPSNLLAELRTGTAYKPAPLLEKGKIDMVGGLSAPVAVDTSTAISVSPAYGQIQTTFPATGLQKRSSITGEGRSMSAGSVHSDIANLWRQAASSTTASSASGKSPETIGTVGEGSLALPQDNLAPSAMSTLWLGCSEDEGTTGPTSPVALVRPGFGESAAKSGLETAFCSPASESVTPGHGNTTAVLSKADKFSSNTNTSDGAISGGDTPRLDDIAVGVVRTSSPALTQTPKHKKSVSDWFKDIGRSNSKGSIHNNIFSEKEKDSIPPVPSLPPVESSIWRPFSPLGMKERLNNRKGASTLTAASRKMGTVEANRAVSSPFVGKKEPLMDATNESMGTEGKVSVEDSWRQHYLAGTLPSAVSGSSTTVNTTSNHTSSSVEESASGQPAMERRQSYSDALMALQDEQGTGSVKGLRAVSNAALMIAISTGSAIADEKAIKLGQRAFPLVNSPAASLSRKTGADFLEVTPKIMVCSLLSPSPKVLEMRSSSPTVLEKREGSLRSPTPKRHLTLDSLGKNTGLAALDFGELETNHVKLLAETESANAYSTETLLSTIKELAGSNIGAWSLVASGASTPSTLTDAIKQAGLGVSENLMTPSELPDNVTRFVPGEFPMTLVDQSTPMSAGEVMEEPPMPSEMLAQPVTKGMAIHHGAEGAETTSANDFSSASAVKAMQDMAKENGPTDNDPFCHPFFSGTALIDFALFKPSSLERQFMSSEDMSSGDAVFEDAEMNPLAVGIALEQTQDVEVNPLLQPLEDLTQPEAGLGEGKPFEIFEDATATGYVSELDLEPEVLTGDDIRAFTPPLDHPSSSERMDDAIAAILVPTPPLASPITEGWTASASAMPGVMAQPVLDSDELRGVCDRLNRGSLSYATEGSHEILTVKKRDVDILQQVAVAEPSTQARKVMRQVSGNLPDTQVDGERTVSSEHRDLELGSDLDMAAVNARQNTSPKQKSKERPEVKRESTVIVRHGVVHRDSGDGIFVRDKLLIPMPRDKKVDGKGEGPRIKRSPSPAETMLRGMLGKIAGKSSEHLPFPGVVMGGDGASSSAGRCGAKGGDGKGEGKKEALRTPTPRIMVTSATSEDTVVATNPGNDKEPREARDGKGGQRIPKRRRGKRSGKTAK